MNEKQNAEIETPKKKPVSDEERDLTRLEESDLESVCGGLNRNLK